MYKQTILQPKDEATIPFLRLRFLDFFSSKAGSTSTHALSKSVAIGAARLAKLAYSCVRAYSSSTRPMTSRSSRSSAPSSAAENPAVDSSATSARRRAFDAMSEVTAGVALKGGGGRRGRCTGPRDGMADEDGKL